MYAKTNAPFALAASPIFPAPPRGEAARAGVCGDAVDGRGCTDLESAAKDLQGGLDYVFEAVAADGCNSNGNVAAAVKGLGGD